VGIFKRIARKKRPVTRVINNNNNNNNETIDLIISACPILA
jgi:hypothetical protein